MFSVVSAGVAGVTRCLVGIEVGETEEDVAETWSPRADKTGLRDIDVLSLVGVEVREGWVREGG